MLMRGYLLNYRKYGKSWIRLAGHTPGHICLYLNQSKTLVTGDALNVIDGKLVGPKPEFSSDIATAKESLKRLTQYDVETVICYHGGVYKDNVNQRLRELAEQ